MKQVTAIIRSLKLDDVCDALNRLGINGLTVTEVRGFGRQRGQTELFGNSDYAINFLPKLKLEVAVAADMVDMVVETIIVTGQTGRVGDGKVFVFDLEKVVRIRTRETDDDAL